MRLHHSDGVTALAVGMLHFAALMDDHEAQRILSYRYKHGLGVPASTEVSAQYAMVAATVALEEFNRVGLTPVVERDRVDETTDDKVQLFLVLLLSVCLSPYPPSPTLPC